MNLSLYNTRSRSIEPFEPIQDGEVRMYACGPTVYNYAHIGNFRTFLFEDILVRALRYSGYRVTHVMNITDVGHLTDDGDLGEDKMIRSAEERGMTPWQIAEFYTEAFFRDAAKLRIERPSLVCKATDHIADMIELIQVLEQRGFTYTAGGNVYFDVSKFERYGDLALLDKADLKAGARVAVDQQKRNPQDFVLWFTNSKFGRQAMVWDSPWGQGYPGWHIECSAMSKKYLGDQFDIHCGGVDHISVHHTNELAQSEAATGKSPWVKYWIHSEFLLTKEFKMSKSSGNFLTLESLEAQGFEAVDYRFFCLGGHYRTQLTFTLQSLEAARNGRRSLFEKVARLPQSESDEGEWSEAARAYLDRFEQAIADDLNTPRALAELWGLIKEQKITPEEKRRAALQMDRVLGLGLAEISASGESLPAGLDEKEILSLIEERNLARKERNFARADEIRSELQDRGIQLVDGPDGTSWQFIGQNL